MSSQTKLFKSSLKEHSKGALQKSSSKELTKLRPGVISLGVFFVSAGVFWDSTGSLLGVCWESAGSPLVVLRCYLKKIGIAKKWNGFSYLFHERTVKSYMKSNFQFDGLEINTL